MSEKNKIQLLTLTISPCLFPSYCGWEILHQLMAYLQSYDLQCFIGIPASYHSRLFHVCNLGLHLHQPLVTTSNHYQPRFSLVLTILGTPKKKFFHNGKQIRSRCQVMSEAPGLMQGRPQRSWWHPGGRTASTSCAAARLEIGKMPLSSMEKIGA